MSFYRTTAGTVIVVSGNCGIAGDVLRFTIFSNAQSLGTTTADSAGAYSSSFTLPSDLAPGYHTIVVSDSDGLLSASTTVLIVAPGASSAAGSSTTGSGLAFTGADVAGTVAVGAGAVGAGGALVLASRKRRRRTS